MSLSNRIAKLESSSDVIEPVFIVCDGMPLDRLELIGCHPGRSRHFDREPDETEAEFRYRCCIYARKNVARNFLPLFFQERIDGSAMY